MTPSPTMRIDFLQALIKAAKFLLIAYALISVAYTTKNFYSSHMLRASTSGVLYPRAGREFERSVAQDTLGTVGAVRSSMKWTREKGLAVQATSDHFVMSKLFSDSLGPLNIKPYYFKARASFDKEDITMSTLVTADRFNVLSRLATNHKGPISAAIHVKDDASKASVMKSLHEMYTRNPDVQRYVDVHLIVDTFDRQFNLWRNVAKYFTRTDYLMMLDVDFHICTNVRQSVRQNPDIMAKLRSGRTALVVPAFEYVVQEDGMDWRTFPTSKGDLLHTVLDEKLDMFHKSWFNGHGSTDYPQWYQATEPYKIENYNHSYEPYIIYKKDDSPWCNERFIGYGANKAACLYEIYLSGVDYWVLPNDFLIHQNHAYPENTRKKERLFNSKLYSNFREELCLRYARTFIAQGDWNTSRADNLRSECQTLRRFRSVARSAPHPSS